MTRIKYIFPALLLAASLAGCQSDKPTPKQQAIQQWNNARAGVLGGLARSQYQNGNLVNARQSLSEALKLAPADASLRVLSGKLYIEQGQLEAAERELLEARKIEPKNAEAAYLSGVVYQRWQKPELACGFYRQASENAPAELAYVLAQAEMLVTLDRRPEALALLQEKAACFEHSGAIGDALGQLLLQDRQYIKAAEMFRQASILTPEDPSIHERLGLALYYGGNYAEACDTLGRLIQDDRYARRADLLAAIGECQMQLGRPGEARQSFESASRLDAASPSLWLALAKAALQTNDVKRADLSLRKSLALDSNSGEAQLLLGYLRLKQNRLPEALSAFQQANRLNPRDTVSLCMVGYVLEKTGHPQQAMDCYGQALKLQPNDPLASRLLSAVSP